MTDKQRINLELNADVNDLIAEFQAAAAKDREAGAALVDDMSPAALDAAEVASLMLNQTAIRLAVTIATAMQRDGYRLAPAEPESTP